MKTKALIITLLLFNLTILYAENNKGNLVVYYFGATSCGHSYSEDCINSIKKLRNEFCSVHKEYNVKFVMVCMDTDIEEGLKFIEKYGYWDEISIGSHYKNELVMNYLDKTEIPGVPHVIVFEDIYENESTPIIKERNTVVDKVGVAEIKEWVNNNFPLE